MIRAVGDRFNQSLSVSKAVVAHCAPEKDCVIPHTILHRGIPRCMAIIGYLERSVN